MILVDGTMEIHDGALETILPMMRDSMTATRLEEGCLIYRFSADLDNLNLIHMVELWESEAALAAHMEGSTSEHDASTSCAFAYREHNATTGRPWTL